MVQIIDNNDGTREYRNDTPGIGKIKENSSKVKTMNKETKFKFVIQQNGKELELTIEEAEKLYNDLAKIFAREIPIKWYPAEPIPYSPPIIPQNPNPWPEQPISLPTIITCNLNAIN